MWTKRYMPPGADGAYTVFGVDEKTNEARFTGYWNSKLNIFTDKNGNDIDERVKYWYDMTNIDDPI